MSFRYLLTVLTAAVLAVTAVAVAPISDPATARGVAIVAGNLAALAALLLYPNHRKDGRG
ncbi:hypothetical protein [Streptomyces aurantiogriseus]|uniref:Secreted protein n=1 Tax=Streptomyces aurantiogriseus TaxID=66870 RepID=A0A918KZW7_9ACTN|nr:hypothetical protein [Streptomyces aurantiogriseus]GGR61055.1 hypothetical protein GCM10010251_92180 [Streptomyces aurantiogriseus]